VLPDDGAAGSSGFIPETWQSHAVDANGDDRLDVHNIDDASLTAATYLCRGGDDLTDAESWIAAVAAHSPDTGYSNRVRDVATRYAEEAAGDS
jgi:membrane-bound lytic murein transglycosylase B